MLAPKPRKCLLFIQYCKIGFTRFRRGPFLPVMRSGTGGASASIDGGQPGPLFYRGSVQLSEKASAQVLNGRPSRCIGQARPEACTPSTVSLAPNAGISKLHTP
jgi:hypothetical protein